MANPEHLEILKQGVEVWNKWRRENLEVKPDLSRANLSRAYLRTAFLASTNFGGANLRRADLCRTNLRLANLRDVDLRGTKLIDADLRRADLRAADLRGAYLTLANIIGAHLGGADFTDVVLGATVFGDSDLSQVKGLDAIRSIAPSTITLNTFYESRGEIKERFMRVCGVPESFIAQMHALVAAAKPIEFYSCFISYSSKNQLFADRLYADLQNKGVRCWLASEDLKIGEKIRIGIDESIRFHDKLLLILSKHSVASDWVEQEVETALDRGRKEKHTVLFPTRLDDTVMKIDTGWPALIKNTRNIGDFRKWRNPESYSKAFDRLLSDLKASE